MPRTLRSVLVLVCLFVVSAVTAEAKVKKAPKNSVVSKSIKNGKVRARDIGNGQVKAAKLAPGAVTGAAIAAGAVEAVGVDRNQIQLRLQGSCTVGEAISAVAVDGVVSCVGVGGSGSATPTGPAGGSLAGSYPNPGIAAGAVGTPELADDAVGSAQVAPDSLTGADIDENTLGGFWRLTGNAGTTPATDFLGTTDNTPLLLKVNGNQAVRLTPLPAGEVAVVAGGSANTATAPATVALGGLVAAPNAAGALGGAVGGGSGNTAGQYATVAGGQANSATGSTASTVAGGRNNVASGNSATVGGGSDNIASALYNTISGGAANTANTLNATIGGGSTNTAAASATTIAGGRLNLAAETDAAIGGGRSNEASGNGATVGGGISNEATDANATVAGGIGNVAAGANSTVAGGAGNDALGTYSFAAGRRAQATTNGTFVFADSNDFDFTPTAANQFSVRSTGGVRFVSGIDGSGTPTAGVRLVSGSSAWDTISDRHSKTNIAPVDSREVLEQLTQVPIKTWSWKTERGVTHMGPMAQDFSRAFGLGHSKKTITTVDPDGVALAAIQGLQSRLGAVRERLRSERQRRLALQRRFSARLDALERRVGSR